MVSPDPEATPRTFPTPVEEQYALNDQLGEGASATVWEATERATGRRVALKRLRPGSVGDRKRLAERFASEARALARLRHPHLVRIEAVLTETGGAPCLVMERLHGCTLAQRLAGQPPLSPEEAFRLLVPLMGALATAHDAGILHRDVKPANLFLREGDDADAPWPVLLDFGAAKLDSGEGKATTSGMTVGTPCYMAPEQAQGLSLGPHTDVWAMGVVWYRCLTGTLPFDAETSLGVVIKLSRERAPRLTERMPELPRALAVAIDRALEPTPSARYPDMRAFARALAHAAVHAQLQVPADPEPVALGAFREWLAEADAESTAQLPTLPPQDDGEPPATESEPEEPAQTVLAQSGKHAAAVPRHRRRAGWWAAAALALGAGAAAAWAALDPADEGTAPAAAAQATTPKASADHAQPAPSTNPGAETMAAAVAEPPRKPSAQQPSAPAREETPAPADEPEPFGEATAAKAAPKDVPPSARRPAPQSAPGKRREVRKRRRQPNRSPASTSAPSVATSKAVTNPVPATVEPAPQPTAAPKARRPRVIEDFNW